MRFGKKKEESPKPKPYSRVKIHEGQKCNLCDKPLPVDQEVIVSTTHPVVWCTPCMGEKEKTHPELVKGVVSKDLLE